MSSHQSLVGWPQEPDPHQRQKKLAQLTYVGYAMNVVFQDLAPAIGRFIQERGFPDDYFLFDLETSGFSREKDLITQIGWAIVRDRQIVNNQALTLNWTRHPGIDQMWLEWRLSALEAAFQKQGKPYHLTYEVLAASPTDPIEALQVLDALLDVVVRDKEWVVGHNLAIFDMSVFDAHRARFLDLGAVDWFRDGIFDTGLFVKASQLDRYPGQGEILDEFFRKIAGTRARGVLWSLDRYCIPTFDLDTRFGIDTMLCHDAGYDCKVGHHLFETLREIGEAYGQEKGPVQQRLF